MATTGELRVIASWGSGEPRLALEYLPSPPLTSLLVGMEPPAALALIPLLFNLCAAAQRAAAGAALGLALSGDGRAIAAEALREHALRILRDWPIILGLQPHPTALVGIGNLTAQAASAQLDKLEAALFGPRGVAALEAIDDWMATPCCATQALAISQHWGERWGVDKRGRAPQNDPTFVRRVAVDPRFSRYQSDCLSLHARMVARLIDAARMLEVLRELRPAPAAERLAAGVGMTEAARGRLVHRVRLEGGKIADYRVETPTEIMLEEGGLLAMMLASAMTAPRRIRATLLRMALNCADPCVPVALNLDSTATAMSA